MIPSRMLEQPDHGEDRSRRLRPCGKRLVLGNRSIDLASGDINPAEQVVGVELTGV